MIEYRVISFIKIIGLLLAGYSLAKMIYQGQLVSESGIEYGVILFGVACSIEAVRNKRKKHDKYESK